ncbi:MAG: hypothetical protein WBB23_03510 [Desulforhopalus sp.]
MLDKETYISGVKTQLDEWDKEIQKLSGEAGSSNSQTIEQAKQAIQLVEDKINAFERSGEEVPGHWETETDSLRNQVENILNSARSSAG